MRIKKNNFNKNKIIFDKKLNKLLAKNNNYTNL